MRALLFSAKLLLLDLAGLVLFFLFYNITHNVTLGVIAGLALAAGQIGWELLRRKCVDTLQWVSLLTILATGAGTLHTSNPLYVMLQPTVLYLLVGWVMLKSGWMERYLPPRALEYVPDLAIAFGYVWAGLMFFSAALNLWAASGLSVLAWGTLMSAWGIASKLALFFVQYSVMKTIGRRRYLARLAMA